MLLKPLLKPGLKFHELDFRKKTEEHSVELLSNSKINFL